MKERLNGITWGIAIGLFLDSLMVVATRGWLLFAFPLLFIPVGVGAVVGVRVARFKDSPRPPRVIALRVLAAIVIWFTCAMGPIAAQWTKLRLEAHAVPVCDRCQEVELKTAVLSFDDPPGYRILLRCECDSSECINFYRNELPQCGWSPSRADYHRDRMWYRFTKSRRQLSLRKVLPGDYPTGDRLADYHGVMINVSCQ